MEPPKGWEQLWQTSVLLAGLLLSCVLQLGVAEKRISVILEPQNPQEGQNVTLSVRGGPQQFTQCKWSRHTHQGGSEFILEYSPHQKSSNTSHNRREWMRPDCSLHISKLRPSDTGNYSVTIVEVAPTKQHPDQRPTQQPEVFYDGSVYLQVSALHQRTITVDLVPQQPRHGQEVILTPRGAPQKFESCEWFKTDSSGNAQSIVRHGSSEPQFPSSQDRMSVQQGCSLRITNLAALDSGTYVVKMQVALDPQKEQPGQGTRPQEPLQEYRGQVDLKVDQIPQQNPQKGNSAGLSYSTGVLAGALLGFFIWTDIFTSLFYGPCFGFRS